jgi:hypothetical protein
MPPGPEVAIAKRPGELRIAASGEGSRLLVPHLDVAQLVLVLPPRLDDAVDAVARKGEHGVDPPVQQTLDQPGGGRLGHVLLPCVCVAVDQELQSSYPRRTKTAQRVGHGLQK